MLTAQLRKYIDRKEMVIAPGVFDGLSARLVEQAGFKAIYASGGAISRSSGFPDIGLLTFDEVQLRYRQMVEVTKIPIIVDADTGYGNRNNVARTFRELQRIGLAAAHLEDQVFPKRCGHLANKQIISCEEMTDKIKAARDALTDDNFVLIARTDAIAVDGFNAAMDRAHAYFDAGADAIFVEAPQTLEQIKKIAEDIKQPKLINMFYGGKTPLVPMKELESMGYAITIIPSDLQRAAIHAMQKTLNTIKKYGDSKHIADDLATFNEREKIIGTDQYI